MLNSFRKFFRVKSKNNKIAPTEQRENFIVEKEKEITLVTKQQKHIIRRNVYIILEEHKQWLVKQRSIYPIWFNHYQIAEKLRRITLAQYIEMDEISENLFLELEELENIEQLKLYGLTTFLPLKKQNEANINSILKKRGIIKGSIILEIGHMNYDPLDYIKRFKTNSKKIKN
jgi:hypothetical protein